MKAERAERGGEREREWERVGRCAHPNDVPAVLRHVDGQPAVSARDNVLDSIPVLNHKQIVQKVQETEKHDNIWRQLLADRACAGLSNSPDRRFCKL